MERGYAIWSSKGKVISSARIPPICCLPFEHVAWSSLDSATGLFKLGPVILYALPFAKTGVTDLDESLDPLNGVPRQLGSVKKMAGVGVASGGWTSGAEILCSPEARPLETDIGYGQNIDFMM